MPVATLKPCTVRGMGANSYVVVDDDEWNVTINQADVDRIVTHFEDQSIGDFPTARHLGSEYLALWRSAQSSGQSREGVFAVLQVQYCCRRVLLGV